MCCFGRNGRWYSAYEPAYARFALEELKEEACVRFTAEVIREERSRSGYDLHLLDVEILSEPEVTAIADVKMGQESASAWGCDLTHGYIEINADYRS